MSFGKFKDDKESPSKPVSKAVRSGSDAILGAGSKIIGKLDFQGAAEIGGEVEGEISTSGRLVISETAKVKARIQGSEIVVKGTVEGDLVASKKLVLLRPARVSGNISSAAISIEEGVLFEGSCQMIQAQPESSKSSQVDANSEAAKNKKGATGTAA